MLLHHTAVLVGSTNGELLLQFQQALNAYGVTGPFTPDLARSNL